MRSTFIFGFLMLITSFVSCQRITNFAEAGSNFMKLYYSTFDSTLTRKNLQDLYEINNSIVIYGGDIFFAVDKIMERLSSVPNIIQRNISSTDYQPTNDAGVIVNVFGKILTNEINANSTYFTEMFVLKPKVTAFYIQNQQYRQSSLITSANNLSEGLRFVS